MAVRHMRVATGFGIIIALAASIGAAAPRALPSIVIVVTDDQRWDTLDFMPTVTRDLVERGVTFANAFATTPLCCPSRASVFTGKYAHNHGVLTNKPPEGGAERFRDASTIATWLDGAGYATGLFGRYLNGYNKLSPYIPPGWDDWAAFVHDGHRYYNYRLNVNGRHVPYGEAPEDYSTTVISAKAVEFVDNAAPGPVFVYLAPQAPHGPAIPHPDDIGKFKDLPPYRPPSYDEEDVSDKPEWIRKLPRISKQKEKRNDALRRSELETLQSVDRGVRDVIAALKRTGRFTSTAFFYLSDNGLTWGEHRMVNRKGCPYEECIRVPLVARVPGIAPRREARFGLTIDLAPTVAALAGVTPPTRVDGLSLLGLLRDPGRGWRKEFLIEMWGEPRRFTGIRVEDWIYVEFTNIERELYDLARDPFQLENRVGHPDYREKMLELRERLERLKQKTR